MPETLTSLLIGAAGGAITAAIQFGFRRFAETSQQRREVVETHLLQLQNAAESLYYRVNNLRDWAGKSVMKEDYYRQSSAYIIGKVLAHESLLVSKGVYAKLNRDTSLKRKVKATLHALNWEMDDHSFLHYHRVQLGEMLLDGDRIVTYTEFLARWSEPRYGDAVSAASAFVQSVSSDRLDGMRHTAAQLISLLAAKTSVPSALELEDEPVDSPGPTAVRT